MTKRNKIIYWISTLWLALGMTSTGIVQLLRVEEEVVRMTTLGYPVDLLTFLGICKILGVAAVLIPKTPLLKEWAYAGFFFNMSGAIYSHLVSGSSMSDIFPPVLLIALMAVSWVFRPETRKVTTVKH